MLDYYEFIEQLERLPANEATGYMRIQGELPAQPHAYGGTDALAYLKRLVDRWTGRHDVDDETPPGICADHCADALLDAIEDSDIEVRFVPDGADESFKTAA